MGFKADQAALVLADSHVVVPIVAVHGARSWGKVVADGVPVVPAQRRLSMLGALPVVQGPERVAAWPTRPVFASTPLLDPSEPVA